jgi:hypothetical protein
MHLFELDRIFIFMDNFRFTAVKLKNLMFFCYQE